MVSADAGDTAEEGLDGGKLWRIDNSSPPKTIKPKLNIQIFLTQFSFKLLSGKTKT
jgi:hypothetical protein